jgi:trans-aconitate methyltransferase
MNKPEPLANLYDALAEAYTAGRHLFDTTPMLEWLIAKLPPNGRILDAGCGDGDPTARFFRKHGYAVTGVDLSPKMIERARRNLPGEEWIQDDMRSTPLPPECFVAVTAIYAVFHLPRSGHAELFRRFCETLQPGGCLLVTLADRRYTGHDTFDGEKEFLGRNLPYSHDLPEIAEQKLRTPGFQKIETRSYETGGETFPWMLAEK